MDTRKDLEDAFVNVCFEEEQTDAVKGGKDSFDEQWVDNGKRQICDAGSDIDMITSLSQV